MHIHIQVQKDNIWKDSSQKVCRNLELDWVLHWKWHFVNEKSGFVLGKLKSKTTLNM